MIQTIRGLHHVTAIAIDPQANIDFYTQVVGLRLVKDTVNFDDPGTYHFLKIAGRSRSADGLPDQPPLFRQESLGIER